MYLVRNLYSIRMERLGVLVLGLNAERLFAPANEAVAKMGMNCLIRLDQYASGDDRFVEAARGLSEDGEYLLYTLDGATRDYDLLFQIQADKRAVYREMETFRTIMWWMFALLVPICALLTTFVNRRIVRPIRLLSEASIRIRGGELGITVPMRGGDELGQLGSAFSGMSVQLKYLVDKSYKEEIALRDARIQAMQSRINAHFLNNALETINWQARMEGSETIGTMVEALSCLLNASMDRNERHLVPLSEELTVAEAYFYFIGLRFGEKLVVWKTVESGLESVLVPRLVIQTLVENAIEHG
ncbi:MAG: histidine kinase, partial [Clostridia bacterium]